VTVRHYDSETLRCHVGDDDCPLCRFIEGKDSTTETLLEVIRILDKELFHQTENNRHLIRAYGIKRII